MPTHGDAGRRRDVDSGHASLEVTAGGRGVWGREMPGHGRAPGDGKADDHADHRSVLPLSEPHDVPGAHFTPRFDVNPNTGEAIGRERRRVVADNTVRATSPHIVFACLTG